MSLNPFNSREPVTGDVGVRIAGAFIPALPGPYVFCKGEPFLTDRKTAVPVEPPYTTPLWGDAPLLTTPQTISREPPFIDQAPSSPTVATPCVAPYNWEAAVALRTVILDTVLDADATDEEKALPGYVPNPGLFLSSKTMADWADPPEYDDESGVAFLWSFPIDRDEIAVTGTVAGQRYKVTVKGEGTREVGEEYVATGAGTGTAKVTAAPLPHPVLRTGQTRYPAYPEVTLVGTAFDGTAFLPGEVGKFTSGNLQICAYRYGFLLGATSWAVAVKIGRATATWSASAETLTLTCDTEDATLYYSTDGSAPTIEYTAPISIADTTTVRWYARKLNADATPVAMMLDSDEWQTEIVYEDSSPPADFTTVYFSELPAFDNSRIIVEAMFQRQPAFYVSASGSGVGEAPDDPGSATSIIGTDDEAPNLGKARGVRTLTASRSGGTLTLTFGGADPVVSGSTGTAKLKYAYSTTDISAGSIVAGDYCEIKTVGDTDWIAIGASANEVGVEFTANGAGSGTGEAKRWDWNTYSTPVSVGTGRVRVRIDRQDDTPYSRDWWLAEDEDSRVFTQPMDLVWLAAGTYAAEVVGTCAVRGGYSSGYTARDVKGSHKTTFTANATAGVLDGVWIDLQKTLTATTIYNCHVSGTYGASCGPWFRGSCYYCSADCECVADDPGFIEIIAIDGTGTDCHLTVIVEAINGVTTSGRDGYQSVASLALGTLIGGTIDISVTSGSGAESADHLADSLGGLSSASVKGSCERGVVGSISCISGNGGDAYGETGYGVPPPFPPPISFYIGDGWGGPSFAVVEVKIGEESDITLTVQSGNGGLGSFLGGSSLAYMSGNIERLAQLSATITSGDGGTGYKYSHPEPYVGGYSGISHAALGSVDWTVGFSGPDSYWRPWHRDRVKDSYPRYGWGGSTIAIQGTVEATLEHGAEGTGNPYYYPDDAGTGAEFLHTLTPTYLTEETCAVTGADWGNGHYGHPDPYPHPEFDMGPWYSGAVNAGNPGSDGVPLEGYETAQGTGTTLGRYWE